MPCSAMIRVDEFAIAGIADDQFSVEDGRAETRGKVVEDDDALSGFAELWTT